MTLRAITVLFLAAALPVQILAESIEPEESLPTTLFRSGDGDPQSYVRLALGEAASYVFCGRGELTLRSRALLESGANRARYRFAVRVDGGEPAREFGYRSYRIEEAFFDGGVDGRVHAASLRRSRIELDRGCHTVRVELAQSTVQAIGLRADFDSRKAAKRPFETVPLVGGRAVEVVLRDERTPYWAVEAGQRAELTVDGPAWVRVLSRSMSWDEPDAYELVIEDGGEPYRSYRFEGKPSRRAKLKGERTRLGRAQESVFAVGAGTHTLSLGPDDPLNSESALGLESGGVAVALRAQVAPRDPGRPVAGERPASWSARARLSTYYDDNILRYSDKFIQRFENGEDPGRFRVESLDDVVVRADLDLERSFTGIAGRRASVQLGLTHRAYRRNSIKDWTQARLEWRQDLALGRRVTLFATTATDFYVRHLRDGDFVGRGSTTDPFQAFEFEKTEFGVSYRFDVGASWTLIPQLSLATFKHSPAWQEFDSDDLKIRLRGNYQLSPRTRLSAAVEWTESDAQGYDEAGETLATSDDTDPSYEQLDVMVAARFELPTSRDQVIFLQAEVGDREYTTSKPESLAPFHSGREDELLRLYASWQIELTPRLDLTVFSQFRDRSSSIPDDLDIGLDKNYEQYEAGVRLTARFE